MSETLKFRKFEPKATNGQEAAHDRAKLTRRGKAVAGLALTGTLLGAGVAGKNVIDDIKENRSQPACDIIVQQDETLYDIKVRIGKAGDSVQGERTNVVSQNGVERTRPQDIQVGDLATIENVDPAACAQAGGIDPEKF